MGRKSIPQTEITGLAGNDNGTSVLGDPIEAQSIANSTLDVISRFTNAVIGEDIETAYGLCANELRSWMSVNRFVSELNKANEDYNGKPIEFSIERITWIYCDEASRGESNAEGDWPKQTPKPNKRAIAYGWVTDLKDDQGDFGRNMAFWVTEEDEGYRIAKFKQYDM